MKRERALNLLSEHKPVLIAEVFNPAIPNCLNVRKKEGGPHISIHLDNIAGENEEHQAILDKAFLDALNEADKVLPNADPAGE